LFSNPTEKSPSPPHTETHIYTEKAWQGAFSLSEGDRERKKIYIQTTISDFLLVGDTEFSGDLINFLGGVHQINQSSTDTRHMTFK